MTPEGRVKRAINKALKKCEDVYVFMPVPSGYGKSTLDYILCVNGKFLAIEAKKPGGEPTPRQIKMMREIERAGGVAIVIDNEAAAAIEISYWMDQLNRS